jgi:hypothetical protein
MEEAMISKFKYVIALVAFMFFIAGCTTFRASNPDKVLEPSSVLRFSDIPIPAGFAPMKQQSYSFENAGVRVGLLKYKGRGTLDQVQNFYKEQMPLSKWNLLNISEFGQRILNFERENETCIISIKSELMTGTVISLSLGPKSGSARNRRLPEEALK